jgi:hypothetical protein
LGGQLECELSDEKLLEFVGRGISAKDKPPSVSGWEVDGSAFAGFPQSVLANRDVVLMDSLWVVSDQFLQYGVLGDRCGVASGELHYTRGL